MKRAILALLTLALLLGSAGQTDAGVIYWTDADAGTIQAINTDGTGKTTVLSGLGSPAGIAVDGAASKLFWSNVQDNTVHGANLNGSGQTTLASGLGTSPQSVAVDATAAQLYWTNNNGSPSGNNIMRANLDGSGRGVFQSDFSPIGLAVDATTSQVFYGTGTSPFAVPWDLKRINTDGTGLTTIFSGGNAILGVAVDELHSKVYWTDYGLGTIAVANLDGTGEQTLLTGLQHPYGIAVDPVGGHIFWANQGTGTISEAGLDGSSPSTLVSGIRFASYLAFQPGNIPGGASAVPEPSTLTLLGIGAAGLAGYGWRPRKQAKA